MSRNPREISREEVLLAMAAEDNNIPRAAKRLDMRPGTLKARLQLYGIKLRETLIREYYAKLGIRVP